MMEAKDTARHQDNCELSHIKINFGKCTCGAEQQAEISFNAGEKQGMVKVVDWIENKRHLLRPPSNFAKMGIDYNEWQAQLKEWGIKED